ncbi:TetM/TetW/TetO/TetS family tetracycline resistance ribosomal protection protein [Bifidobacterium imperatoris]|uniref:GTP-binding protein n=1 Tax=Bifidobacterium imperatoris TaxID=2020965 RepID=A0A2N5IV27_9BIFI|nr:TetM/TetW/TetO/TetS family tetracycline resistance ribosomal protection protein [Bifidobacterium imperatoris]PLS25829.1 GTP-binding protein [Bifidobacterium imperatoris]QSY57875.1 TetM/TetW/TetO/TetS family tetracycline resistance ribosomal protection protein [Bifidobacterium imperatoris]
MKRIVAGIVAHVDAGKTTLSEALLYRSGEIRKLGRVDHGDAFLDTNALEKARGITIFAHQALVEHGNLKLTLLDTPGHVDFAAETERVLNVLDYAILVVSGTDGVQGHTETLWRLLARYRVPTFIFVNKCDAAGFDREAVLAQLRKRLSDAVFPFPQIDDCADATVDFGNDAEDIATLDEQAMNEYLEQGVITIERVRRMVQSRELFPVYFGSALKLEGVEEFLDGMEVFTREPNWPNDFGAQVFKIAHDNQHNRMTWLRVTGGVLKAKAMVSGNAAGAFAQSDGEQWQEKIDQVRIYNGAKFETVTEVSAGGVCAVTGLTHTFPGAGLGAESNAEAPALQPVLTYTVLPAEAAGLSDLAASGKTSATGERGNTAPDGEDTEESADAQESSPTEPVMRPKFDDLTLHKVLAALRELEDEDPLLHVVWVERLQEIHVQLMGAVQLEIIQQTLSERFGLDVVFGAGSILYRETITAPIEGAGHFEPLRHYAEAHILLEPGEPGSGVNVTSAMSENDLDRNWQRLILTHLTEREHVGVLIGAPLTDIKMTLVAGKAHLKHTEGGDFRQATYRAIRQGLMEAHAGVIGHPQTPVDERPDTSEAGNCRILEPWYRFRLEVPSEMIGRAMSDIQRMAGTFDSPADDGEYAMITGSAPVSEMRDYAMDVSQYTHGRGRFSATFGGYRPCHNENQVIRAAQYDPESDLDNTPDSVFCAHGAGYPVKWYKVPEFKHLDYAYQI